MLRSLLVRYDELTKENTSLCDQVKRLKADHSEALKTKVESLKDDLVAKEDELAAAKARLAKAEEKIDGLSVQLADVISEKQLAEEQLRLRIRLLLQQFGQHVEQSISQQQRSPQQPPTPQPPQQLAPQQPPTLPTVEAEPSVPERAPQLPCDNAPTDEYTSSSSGSSESECEPGPTGPPPSEL